jgi:hypothetical protein
MELRGDATMLYEVVAYRLSIHPTTLCKYKLKHLHFTSAFIKSQSNDNTILS